jgi:hypothetical protein
MSFFKRLLKVMLPDYSVYKQLGLEPHIFNSDFMLQKRFSTGEVFSLHLGVEPFNTKFSHLIDFKFDEGCLIIFIPDERIELHHDKKQKLLNIFETVHKRENWLFCFNPKMDILENKTKDSVTKAHGLFAS